MVQVGLMATWQCTLVRITYPTLGQYILGTTPPILVPILGPVVRSGGHQMGCFHLARLLTQTQSASSQQTFVDHCTLLNMARQSCMEYQSTLFIWQLTTLQTLLFVLIIIVTIIIFLLGSRYGILYYFIQYLHSRISCTILYSTFILE